VKRTELAEAVEAAAGRLRTDHIRFEVWDGDLLSEQLRGERHLVSTFFGSATADIYCTPAPEVITLSAIGRPTVAPTSARVSSLVPAAKPTAEVPTPPEVRREPTFSRWLSVTPGDLMTFGLGNLKNFSSPHRDSHQSWAADTPPSISIGISIAADPLLALEPSTSRIRQGFLGLLTDSPISEFIAALTPDAATEQWRSHNDVGRAHYAAVRAPEGTTGAPSAWARLLLAAAAPHSTGLDPRCTYLILHVDRTRRGEDTASLSADLRRWRRSMSLALAVPGAIAEHLTERVGIDVGNDPSPMIGFWLAASSDLTQLINTDGLNHIEGSHLSRWYDAYAVADTVGRPPNDVAAEWLTQLCDRALHLDGYEDLL
jgi:hypothetical protein